MSKSEIDERFWFLAPDVLIPVPAVVAVLQLERAGHRLTVAETGDRILVERGPGVDIDPVDLDELRRHKTAALEFIKHALQVH